MYYENSAYEAVYKRARFRNSQELLFHNLKVKSDPLLAPPPSNQFVHLYRDAYGDLLGDVTEAMTQTFS